MNKLTNYTDLPDIRININLNDEYQNRTEYQSLLVSIKAIISIDYCPVIVI